MKRRRQEAGLHHSSAPLRIEKDEPVKKLDFAGGTDAAGEIFEIGAAAEGDVLAIIDVLATGQHVGGCAAAKERALVKQTYAPAGFSQRDAGCQSLQPAAHHHHALPGYSPPYA